MTDMQRITGNLCFMGIDFFRKELQDGDKKVIVITELLNDHCDNDDSESFYFTIEGQLIREYA